jgi:hypothetical protein
MKILAPLLIATAVNSQSMPTDLLEALNYYSQTTSALCEKKWLNQESCTKIIEKGIGEISSKVEEICLKEAKPKEMQDCTQYWLTVLIRKKVLENISLLKSKYT